MQISNFNYSPLKSNINYTSSAKTISKYQFIGDSFTSNNKTISFGAMTPSSTTIKFKKLLTPYTLDIIGEGDAYKKICLKNDRTGEYIKISEFEPASDWRSCDIEYNNGKKDKESKSAVFHSAGYYDGSHVTNDSLTCETNNMSKEEFIKKIDIAFQMIRKYDSAPNERCISDAYRELKVGLLK